MINIKYGAVLEDLETIKNNITTKQSELDVAYGKILTTLMNSKGDEANAIMGQMRAEKQMINAMCEALAELDRSIVFATEQFQEIDATSSGKIKQ